MWRKLLPFLAVTLSYAPDSACQVNVERMRGDEEVEGVSGGLGADISLRAGDVEVVLVGLDASIVATGSTATLMVFASGEAGWEDGDRFSNQSLFHLRGVFRPGKRLRPEAFIQVNYDKASKLDLRLLGGGGLRTLLLKSDRAGLWWGTAYMAEREQLDLAPAAAHPEDVTTHRWSNYISARVEFSESARVTWTQYYQPALDAFEDARALTDLRAVVDASERVSLVTTFRLQYDSRPPDGAEQVNTSLRMGVNLLF